MAVKCMGRCGGGHARYLMRRRRAKGGCGRERVWFGGTSWCMSIVQRNSTIHEGLLR